MTIFTREIRTIEEFELLEGELSCRVKIKNDIFFVSKQAWIDAILETTDPFKALSLLKRYHLKTNDWWQKIQTIGYHDNIHQMNVDYNAHKEWISKESEMVFVDHSSHLLYDITGDLIPRAYRQNYIGGIDNEYYDLDMVERLLKEGMNKGFILEYNRERIPGYNASKKRFDSVAFTWILPKDEYNKIWQELKSKHNYPSTELKNAWQNDSFKLVFAKYSKHGQRKK